MIEERTSRTSSPAAQQRLLADPLPAPQLLSDNAARALELESLLIAYATNGVAEDQTYRQLRRHFSHDPALRPLLPRWLKTYRSLDAFWHFIRLKRATYLERKRFISEAFEPLHKYLRSSPVLANKPAPLSRTSAERIKQSWDKALAKARFNPEGAITLAIITLENTCKNILEQLGASEGKSTLELYGLYQETVKALEIFPRAKNDVAFTMMLRNLSDVVSGLELLNTELSAGDRAGTSHAQAELTVNLAGAVSSFLVSSLEEQETS